MRIDMIKRMKQSLIVLTMTPFFWIGSLHAEDDKTSQSEGGWGVADPIVKKGKEAKDKSKHVCAKDRKKFCSEIKPGDGRIAACMEEHKEELSADCKAHRELMKEERGDVLQSCSAEIAKYCPAPPTDTAVVNAIGSKTRKCLSMKLKEAKVDTSIEFSESCKSEFKEFRQARKAGKKGKVGTTGGNSTSAE